MLRVDLGSGLQWAEVLDYIHVDRLANDHIDYVWNLENGLPRKWTHSDAPKVFEDNTVDEFRAHHIFEHLSPDRFMVLMDEMWDALKPEGILHVYVPNGRHIKAAWSDPTHKRVFLEETFRYWTHESLAAYPYTQKQWIIDMIRVNGTAPDDLWEIEVMMRPVKY